MLFTRRNNMNISKQLRIISDNGMMGILNVNDNSCMLPTEYDNVFVYGENVFVVHKKGKIGAVRIESDKVCFIAECEYDTLDTYGQDLIFCNDSRVRYYHAETKSISDFTDIIIEPPFLFCKDEKYQYILYGELGEVIYKKEYTSYSESCFCFCGSTEKGPVFYDARYSTYLYPADDGYKVYDGLFNHPIIVNRWSIANITEGECGVGVIDSYGNEVIENKYDKINLSLKIVAKKGNEITEKIIPLSQNEYEKGMVSDIENWI